MLGGEGKLKLTLGAIIGRDEESIERPIMGEGIAGRGTGKDSSEVSWLSKKLNCLTR